MGDLDGFQLKTFQNFEISNFKFITLYTPFILSYRVFLLRKAGA